MPPNSFDPHEYLNHLGKELVLSFEGARFSTTPGLIGSAKENPVRKKLEQVLPWGLAVGTGCVIDSFGSVSKQTDVVIYEREYCPIFSINDDPAATFFPCEGVIAVGEIKSSLASKDLKDIFTKIKSVKQLQRFAGDPVSDTTPGSEPAIPYRSYGSRISTLPTRDGEYNQSENLRDRIHGFALAGSLSLSQKTLFEKFEKLSRQSELQFIPDTIVTLDDAMLFRGYMHKERTEFSTSPSSEHVSGVYSMHTQNNRFQFLLSRIYTTFQKGRTVSMSAFNRYLAASEEVLLRSGSQIRGITDTRLEG